MSKEENSSAREEARGNDIRVSAMNMLARREHCRSELFTKLIRRFPDSQKVEQELDRLQADGLQSDQRFVQSFIAGRIYRNQGPLKIRQELQRFELNEVLVSEAFEEAGADWLELAVDAAKRKFAGKSLKLPKERDRARQFLYRRGFPSQTCVRAIEQVASELEN